MTGYPPPDSGYQEVVTYADVTDSRRGSGCLWVLVIVTLLLFCCCCLVIVGSISSFFAIFVPAFVAIINNIFHSF